MDLFEAIRQGHDDDVSRLLDAHPDSLEKQRHADAPWVPRYRPLAWAACNGRVGMVRLLVQRGASIHATGDHGRTALYCAAEEGHEEIVAYLLSQGAQADITDCGGMTPLTMAIERGHWSVVTVLLQHMEAQGLETTDTGGKTAMDVAVQEGREEMVAYLLSQGPQMEIKECKGMTPLMVQMLAQHMGAHGLNRRDKERRTVLHWAAQEGHEETVGVLLRQGAQADIKDCGGMTPLMEAIYRGHLGVVKMLVQHMGERGQGLEERDYQGRTALYCAAEEGHEEMVTVLLGQGARVDIKDSEEVTPLMVAIDRGHLGVVKVLVKHMGRRWLQNTDEDEKTALYVAAQEGHEDIVAFLLSQGARADTRGGGYWRMPIMVAAAGGHLNVVKVLLQRMGKEVLEEGDKWRRTVLHHASLGGHEETVAFLLSQGASLNIKDGPGHTPLMNAAGEGHVGVVKMLMQHMDGQGMEERDRKGRTALYWAAEMGQEEMVAFLLSQGAQPGIKDLRDVTILMTAAEMGHVGVVKMLVQHMEGKGLDERDYKKRTALYYAAREGHEEIVRALLLAGADPTITNHRGRTPWAIADVMRRQGCVEVLKVSRQCQ
jgi:ankyrin repeat protein